ncbi:hypothetical protein BV898_03321 [Hypsibius exemplaris]|uniref:Uncharacterized protein n=1 Tax=Hypsibius exemplaris TaxID=2072580 RepID=A0A1W0X6B1_HYPEX|nr:hypothetical protein BV898_03321 [Hypsibius exemplaris]
MERYTVAQMITLYFTVGLFSTIFGFPIQVFLSLLGFLTCFLLLENLDFTTIESLRDKKMNFPPTCPTEWRQVDPPLHHSYPVFRQEEPIMLHHQRPNRNYEEPNFQANRLAPSVFTAVPQHNYPKNVQTVRSRIRSNSHPGRGELLSLDFRDTIEALANIEGTIAFLSERDIVSGESNVIPAFQQGIKDNVSTISGKESVLRSSMTIISISNWKEQEEQVPENGMREQTQLQAELEESLSSYGVPDDDNFTCAINEQECPITPDKEPEASSGSGFAIMSHPKEQVLEEFELPAKPRSRLNSGVILCVPTESSRITADDTSRSNSSLAWEDVISNHNNNSFANRLSSLLRRKSHADGDTEVFVIDQPMEVPQQRQRASTMSATARMSGHYISNPVRSPSIQELIKSFSL